MSIYGRRRCFSAKNVMIILYTRYYQPRYHYSFRIGIWHWHPPLRTYNRPADCPVSNQRSDGRTNPCRPDNPSYQGIVCRYPTIFQWHVYNQFNCGLEWLTDVWLLTSVKIDIALTQGYADVNIDRARLTSGIPRVLKQNVTLDLRQPPQLSKNLDFWKNVRKIWAKFQSLVRATSHILSY